MIKGVDDDDWATLRSVRLAALAESPRAFGSTLEREQAFDEEAWRDRIRDSNTFLAIDGGRPVGIATGVSGDRADERRLVSMWVRPDHRGLGIASALLGAVTSWARADGATMLTLWVEQTNDTAANLYRRAGFVATGESKPLPSNPSLTEDELALELG